ncbi:DUF3846 domain-containing protein [Xanthocytophaga agilis]|uniref:DUF3846 domain-containing protein n=1 Tax=Xanthocytophaga agilis TaxID=3048010 RepID=A0AAE3R4C0_9BACT|nr:DUF3846 domain-containing protein [Xanthocytophaga agilis]MDJ1503504.1 DUF3846 domain-containing protein [Xanthocytophaga agilis]
MNTIQAIKIDVATQSVYIVDIPEDDTLDSFYKHINCDTVSHFNLDDYHGCYVDDEGLYRDHPGYWSLSGFRQPIAGNGIIAGADPMGNTASAKRNFIDWVKENITFYKECEEEPAITFLS